MFNLQTAIDNAKPGEVVFVPTGLYIGPFTCPVSGVEFIAEDGVILDGPLGCGQILNISGSDTIWNGFEIICSDPKRVWEEPGYPVDGRPTGLHITGARTRIINCSIHDCGTGIGLWKAAIDASLYGCLVYDNGWVGGDRKHGPGIYTQNEQGTKIIEECVCWGNYTNGIQAYGSSSAPVIGFKFINNVIIGNPTLIGGAGPTKNIEAAGNHFNGHTRFGYTNDPNQLGNFHDNIVRGSIEFNRWESLDVVGNVLDSTIRYEKPASGNYTWNILDNVLLGSGVKVIWLYNKYEPRRAILVVWNWDRKHHLELDCSYFLSPGSRYIFTAIYNMRRHYQCGLYTGEIPYVRLPVPNVQHTFIVERV